MNSIAQRTAATSELVGLDGVPPCEKAAKNTMLPSSRIRCRTRQSQSPGTVHYAKTSVRPRAGRVVGYAFAAPDAQICLSIVRLEHITQRYERAKGRRQSGIAAERRSRR